MTGHAEGHGTVTAKKGYDLKKFDEGQIAALKWLNEKGENDPLLKQIAGSSSYAYDLLQNDLENGGDEGDFYLNSGDAAEVLAAYAAGEKEAGRKVVVFEVKIAVELDETDANSRWPNTSSTESVLSEALLALRDKRGSKVVDYEIGDAEQKTVAPKDSYEEGSAFED